MDNLAGTTNDLTIGGSTTPITYNAASQITSAPRSNSTYSWTSAAPANPTYSVNGVNQYTAVETASFGYDQKGNLTSDGAKTFGYSSENLLTSAPGTTLTYGSHAAALPGGGDAGVRHRFVRALK